MSFYVELFSNTTSELYENKISNFVTKLYNRISLTDDFQVGLSEISYPKSWYNIKNDFKILCFDVYGHVYLPNLKLEIEEEDSELGPEENIEYKNTEKTLSHGFIKKGFYQNVENLVDKINFQLTAFSQLKTTPKLGFDQISQKITVIAGQIEGINTLAESNVEQHFTINVFPFLGDEIELMLGLKNYNEKGFYDLIQNAEGLDNDFILHANVTGGYESFRPVEINAGVDNLLVYCDLIYPQYVSNASVKLLRTVEIPNDCKFGDNIVIKYNEPHYLPLLYKEFETIEIDIKDDNNKKIDFLSGRVRIKLHFKNGFEN